MGKCWYYFLFLVWFSYLIVTSILLFTNGFLLNRIVIDKNSTCVSRAECSKRQSQESHGNCTNSDESDIPICSSQKSRVILLIIDAFRHDFALYNEQIQYPLPYENKMPFINKLITENPSYNRLYKFIADPPTTTMQRLKALTTGSLPTFIDAGSNFASTEIDEDNLLNQLIIHKKNIVFLGDDTWVKMYPNHFLRSYPYPSFNVWDLDTVDTGVTSNIFKELKNNDWQLLIGHYLGVDHCGHRYGPNHPEMSRKLQEMNEVIKNITTQMDDGVMLFIIGDHGMTGTGDHGGDSVDEVTAAMFVHSKSPLIEQNEDAIKQVDLIPTLATILGIPIPYANLGTTVHSCLPLLNSSTIVWPELASIIWGNLQQMSSYIHDYSSITNTFKKETIEEFDAKYKELKDEYHDKKVDDKAFVKICREYMSNLRKMCEEKWIQFDSFLMTRGLILCFVPIFFVYTIVNCIPTAHLLNVFSKLFLIIIYVTTAVIAVTSAVCYHFGLISNFIATTYFFSGVAAVFILAIVLAQNWEIISSKWHEMSKKYTWTDVFCRFVLLISVCAFLSNSFVVQECYVSLFLLLTLITVSIFDLFYSTTRKAPKVIKNPLRSGIKLKLFLLMGIFCILIRFSTYYWQCREEQNCSEVSSQKLYNANRTMLIFALICVGLVITLTRMWLRHCGNLTAFNLTVLLAQYAPTVIIVCSGGFWVLHYFPVENKSKLAALWQADYLALVAYSFIFFGLFVTFVKPMTAFIITKNVSSDLHTQTKSIPQVFHQIKNLFYQKHERKDEVPVVCGLATVYSATFAISIVYILLLFALLLGNAAAPSAVLLYFSTVIVLCISSIVRYEKATNINQLLEIPTITLLTWAFLAIYFFYGTGHQPTFPNINWEAAFVGTGGTFTKNFIPAALVLINTFGSYIVVGFLLPTLHIAPFTIYAMFPSLANRRKEEDKDLSKGDLTLFEYDHVLLTSAFSVSCKYICYFAIRVFVTMLAATVHCRHLMVWKIFAPKMIFEAISLFITIPSVLFGYILLISINSAVNKLIKGLDKGDR